MVFRYTFLYITIFHHKVLHFQGEKRLILNTLSLRMSPP